MSAILKFDFHKREQLRFSEVNYLTTQKRLNFARGNYIFPKTRGNKNKPWTHSTPLKWDTMHPSFFTEFLINLLKFLHSIENWS